jgi:peptidoglycan hydrolase FlgJ
MQVSAITTCSTDPTAWGLASGKAPDAKADDDKLRQTFQDFVGETLFGEMLKQMRKSVGKTPYFHGGRTEEVFQQQLDQVMAQKMSKASADKLAGPMYELFSLSRK